MVYIPFDIAVQSVAGFGVVLLMEANESQVEQGIDWVATVKAGDHHLGSYALDA